MVTLKLRQTTMFTSLVELPVGKCKALAHLDLRSRSKGRNGIGDEGAGRLARVLGECNELAYLDLRLNGIGAESVGRLAGVLGACKALAHLGLGMNDIGYEGAGRLARVLEECPGGSGSPGNGPHLS